MSYKYGEEVEVSGGLGTWVERKFLCFTTNGKIVAEDIHGNAHCWCAHRPIKKKQLRPWTRWEAVGKSVRFKTASGIPCCALVVNACESHVILLSHSGSPRVLDYHELLKSCETIDGKPCGVEE